jgi:hypothetical protein
MGTPHPAMHRTVLAVDVEAFSEPSRIPHHGVIRDGLYAALENACRECGIGWSDCYHEDRGDGLIVLMPADVPKSRVVRLLPHSLAAELRNHNAGHDEDARIRLRVAVHAGEVREDEHGLVGDPVILTFRLIDAPPLKSALARSPGVLALIVSDRFFEDVIRNDPACDPGSYRPVDVDVKETHASGWISLPDSPRPNGQKIHHRPSPPRDPTHRHRAIRKRSVRRPVALLAVVLLAGLAATDALASAPPPVLPCPDPVQLNLVTSAEQASTLRAIAVNFEHDSKQFDEQGCKEVNVLVSVGTSRDVVETLGRGWTGSRDVTDHGPEPHIWLPDSNLEVARAVAATVGRTDVGLIDQGPLSHTPLVLGAGEAVATRLGGQGVEFHWRDLLGIPSLTHEDPETSGAGLAATVGLYQAELGPESLTAAALRKPGVLRRLRGVERRTTSEGAECGQDDVALLASEKAVVDYNQRCREHPLRIMYPQEGALSLDHPFVAVSWLKRPTNQRRQHMIDKFLGYLRQPSAQQAVKRDGFRDRDGTVGAFAWPRADLPAELHTDADPVALVRAWKGVTGRTRVRLVVDGTAPQDLVADFVGRLNRLVDTRDEVTRSDFADGMSTAVTGAITALGDARAKQSNVFDIDAVVLVTAGSGTTNAQAAGHGAPVKVHGVSFTPGACRVPSSELRVLTSSTFGTCHVITGAADVETALDDIADGLWGGG